VRESHPDDDCGRVPRRDRIDIYQERKTENALSALRDLSSPGRSYWRDGQRVRIPGRDVVRGDYLLLARAIACQPRPYFVECMNFSVDESTLTGESVPVRKAECDPSALAEADGAAGW